MAIEIPNWLEPVLNFYGIPWPDIDEDAFEHLKLPLRTFGEDLQAFGDAIDTALRLLESANSSHSLSAVTNYFQSVRTDFLDPVRGVCDDLAGWPCDIAYEAVVGVKEGLLALLAAEIANDVLAAIGTAATLGTDTALTAAEAAGVREAVHEALIIAENDVASAILNAANHCLDNLVNSLVNPFINSVSLRVEGSVDAYAPQLLLRQALSVEQWAGNANNAAAERLHLSPSDLDRCLHAIYDSAVHLDRASSKLESTIEELFSHPSPSPKAHGLSSALRMAAKGVVHTIEQDLIEALRQLVDHVVRHFGTLLEDYKRAIDDLDHQARAAASNEHVRAGSAVTVISAAGTGTAAGVAFASGLVNAEETGRIRVESASVIEIAESVAVAKAPTGANEGIVGADDSVESLQTASAARTGGAGPVGGAGAGVETLQTKKDGAGPHVAPAERGPEPTTSVGKRHDAGHVRHSGSATPTATPAGVSHLHAKHPEGSGTQMGVATGTGHDVDGPAVPQPAPKPEVDVTPADTDD